MSKVLSLKYIFFPARNRFFLLLSDTIWWTWDLDSPEDYLQLYSCLHFCVLSLDISAVLSEDPAGKGMILCWRCWDGACRNELQTQFSRVFNFSCPRFLSRCRGNSETGNVRSSWLLLSANCSYKTEHPSANLPPPESSPAMLMHHVTWLIQTARSQPSPIMHIRAVSASSGTAYCFGADELFKANIWDQIHPWCNSIEATNVLHLREMWSLLHKDRFFSAFLSFTSLWIWNELLCSWLIYVDPFI